MDIEKIWEKALRNTEIIRSRIQLLKTSADTHVPYILLSESTVNEGDTVVRKGELVVQKPALIIPPHHPIFNGFEFDEAASVDQDSFVNFLLVRGIQLPSMMYDNKTSFLEVFEGGLSKAIKHYNETLRQTENTHVGLVKGPEDCWQFSLIIFICAQVARNADHDIRKLMDEYRKKGS